MALAIRLENGTATSTLITVEATNGPSSIVIAWFALNIIGGHFLLPLLVTTFLFTKAKRDVTLVNLLITFIITSVFACLLLYTGRYIGPPPDTSLCIFQAATTNACPPMWTTAVVVFVVCVWSSIGGRKTDPAQLGPRKVMMIIAPYIVFLPFLIANIVVGTRHPETVRRSQRYLYCNINNRSLDVATRVYTSTGACLAVLFTVLVGIRFYRAYNYHRRAGDTCISTDKLAIRLYVFISYSLVGLIFSAWNTFGNSKMNTNARDMYIASLSIAAFLIFGTQRDVFQAWRRLFSRRVDHQHHYVSFSRPHSIITASNESVVVPNGSIVVIGDPAFDDDLASLRPKQRRDGDWEKPLPEIPNPSANPAVVRFPLRTHRIV